MFLDAAIEPMRSGALLDVVYARPPTHSENGIPGKTQA